MVNLLLCGLDSDELSSRERYCLGVSLLPRPPINPCSMWCNPRITKPAILLLSEKYDSINKRLVMNAKCLELRLARYECQADVFKAKFVQDGTA